MTRRRADRGALSRWGGSVSGGRNPELGDIGALPDVTIAESLVRLPGINGTRDRGNTSQAVVRGLGPRLVLGLVNGREVASSEPSRNVRWEIYPSEVVAGADVYKSQSADLVAGGVAGTIDIRTVRPFNYSGPKAMFRGGPVYYEAGSDIPGYDPYGFRGSGSYAAAAAVLQSANGRAIAVPTATRMRKLPDVATFIEQGINDKAFQVQGFICLVGPAAMPKDIVVKLSDMMVEAGKSERIQKILDTFGIDMAAQGHVFFEKILAEQGPVWIELVKSLNIEPQ